MLGLLDDGVSPLLIAIAERSLLIDVGNLASTAAAFNARLHHWLKRQHLNLHSLASIMPDARSLEELRSRSLMRLDSLQLGDQGIKTIAAAAEAGSLPNLQELHCSDNGVSSGLTSLAISSASLCRLRELWLDGNKIGAETLTAFCDQLTKDSFPLLEDIYLSNNCFGCRGLASLSSAFRRALLPRSLLQLDLAGCGIGDEGLAAFASALAGCARSVPSDGPLAELEHLGLSRNVIGGTGLMSLAAAVARGALPALEQLELGSNHITDAGVHALACSLAGGQSLPRLEALLLYRNEIGDGGLEALTNAIDVGCVKSLCFLALDQNPASPAAHALANAALNSRKRCARRRGLEQAYERGLAYERGQTTAHTAGGVAHVAATAGRKCTHNDEKVPLLLQALLGDAEISEIHAAARKLMRDPPTPPPPRSSPSASSSSSSQPPPFLPASSKRLSPHRYSPNHQKLFLHSEGYFQAECPHICHSLLAQMRARCDGERPDGSQLRIRTIEYHTYTAGGSLLDPAHRDHGSTRSLSVLLSSREEHSGGEFVTWSGGKAVTHALVRGDGILFSSERIHNVSAVTEGIRHALVIELWEAEGNNQTDRYA